MNLYRYCPPRGKVLVGLDRDKVYAATETEKVLKAHPCLESDFTKIGVTPPDVTCYQIARKETVADLTDDLRWWIEEHAGCLNWDREAWPLACRVVSHLVDLAARSGWTESPDLSGPTVGRSEVFAMLNRIAGWCQPKEEEVDSVEPESEPEAEKGGEAFPFHFEHNEDYTEVTWGEEGYSFSLPQAKAFKKLLDNFKRGWATHGKDLVTASENGSEVRNLFRSHKAWVKKEPGTCKAIIWPATREDGSERQGFYVLIPPPKK